MVVSYAKILRGKESQVLEELDRDGMGEVMERYGLKNDHAFALWVGRHRDPELKRVLGMDGGEKALFCRNHRDTILDCLEIFGEAFVLDRFNIKRRDTLDNIVKGLNEPFSRKLSRADRVELKATEALSTLKAIAERLDKIETKLSIHDADIAEDRGKINELISFVKDFSHNVSDTVARVLVQPLIQRTIQDGCGDMELPFKDPLELDIATDIETKTDNPKPKTSPVPTVEPGFEPNPETEKLREAYMTSHPMSKEVQNALQSAIIKGGDSDRHQR